MLNLFGVAESLMELFSASQFLFDKLLQGRSVKIETIRPKTIHINTRLPVTIRWLPSRSPKQPQYSLQPKSYTFSTT